jgi:hypothetical protein
MWPKHACTAPAGLITIAKSNPSDTLQCLQAVGAKRSAFQKTRLILTSLAIVIYVTGAAQARAVADDFKIIAKFGPGYNSSRP